ncbi:MAG: NUDIX hydrolase [Candidatus Dojkabacteria bacterium]|nr:NUDIX hydrolase [Candidatus Dojkabacteria bacterium]
MYQIPEDKGFLIAVKALIINSSGEVLLLKVNSGLRDSERWDLPGGLMEYDDTVESRLQKEVIEETGIKIKDPKLIAVSETIFEDFVLDENNVKDMKVVVIGFELHIGATKETIRLSEEHAGYAWYRMEDLNTIELSKPSKAIITKIPK